MKCEPVRESRELDKADKPRLSLRDGRAAQLSFSIVRHETEGRRSGY
jgi:hypothetical protein